MAGAVENTAPGPRSGSAPRPGPRAAGQLRAPGDIDKPFVAVCNSYVDIVPGHVHLQEFGRVVKEAIREAGGIPFEFNTIGVDDGIVMGHEGMRYSPRRASSSPTRSRPPHDLLGARMAGTIDDARLEEFEQTGCPTCGPCSGMFTANSMNCLCEALGVALPGNGTLLATSAGRHELARRAARQLLHLVAADTTFLDIVTAEAIDNAIALDMAMGGSTNTVLHVLALANEAGVDHPIERVGLALRRQMPFIQPKEAVPGGDAPRGRRSRRGSTNRGCVLRERGGSGCAGTLMPRQFLTGSRNTQQQFRWVHATRSTPFTPRSPLHARGSPARRWAARAR